MLNPPRSWYPNTPKIFIWLGWMGVRLLGWLLGIRSKDLNNIPKKGPCLLLVPHLNFMDAPFLIAALPRPSRFIADSFFVFKNIFLAWFMWLGGTVPVNRRRPDVRAVRQYLKLLADGELCVLFPEGARSFSGKVRPPMIPAVKLISKLKIPVHLCVIEGAYDSWPRWDSLPRLKWGKIKVTYAGIFREGESAPTRNKKELWWRSVYDLKKKIDLDAERENIQNAMAAMADKESANIVLTRRGRPRALPNLFFFCPLCVQPESLAWNKDSQKLICGGCQASFSPEGPNLRLQTKDSDVTRTASDWFDVMVKNLGLKPNKELVVTAKIMVRVEPSGNPSLMDASARLDERGLVLRTRETSMIQIPIGVFARGDAKGTSVVEVPYRDQTITLHSKDLNISSWLILSRKFAGWKNYFSA